MVRAMAIGSADGAPGPSGRRSWQRWAPRAPGFTYLAVLLLVALMGLALASAGVLWSTSLQREKERDLLFTGNQFRQAIGAYYEKTPGGAKQYPSTLEQLLKDERYPVVVRHLRKVYADPMTGKADWTLVKRPDGQIVGVSSRSTKVPLKRDNFDNPLDRDFRSAGTLAEWKFIYTPGSGPAAPQPAAGGVQLFSPAAPQPAPGAVQPFSPAAAFPPSPSGR